MIEEGVLALAKAAVPALGGRIYADTLPSKCDYPAGIQKAGIGGRSEPTFDGPGVQIDRYQFDFAGLKRRDVSAARESLIVALDGFYGAMPNGESVILIRYIQPLSLPYDDQKQVFWCGVEFYVRHCR